MSLHLSRHGHDCRRSSRTSRRRVRQGAIAKRAAHPRTRRHPRRRRACRRLLSLRRHRTGGGVSHLALLGPSRVPPRLERRRSFLRSLRISHRRNSSRRAKFAPLFPDVLRTPRLPHLAALFFVARFISAGRRRVFALGKSTTARKPSNVSSLVNILGFLANADVRLSDSVSNRRLLLARPYVVARNRGAVLSRRGAACARSDGTASPLSLARPARRLPRATRIRIFRLAAFALVHPADAGPRRFIRRRHPRRDGVEDTSKSRVAHRAQETPELDARRSFSRSADFHEVVRLRRRSLRAGIQTSISRNFFRAHDSECPGKQ